MRIDISQNQYFPQEDSRPFHVMSYYDSRPLDGSDVFLSQPLDSSHLAAATQVGRRIKPRKSGFFGFTADFVPWIHLLTCWFCAFTNISAHLVLIWAKNANDLLLAMLNPTSALKVTLHESRTEVAPNSLSTFTSNHNKSVLNK